MIMNISYSHTWVGIFYINTLSATILTSSFASSNLGSVFSQHVLGATIPLNRTLQPILLLSFSHHLARFRCISRTKIINFLNIPNLQLQCFYKE